jgi:hypothetical protein
VTPFPSQRWRRLLLLFLASGAGLLSAGTSRSQDLSHALNSPTVTGWALADFNGDDTFGLATASSPRHDARGYSQEVRVSFGPHQHSSFKFRSRSASVILSARDLDGDQDRDLVVREPLSMTPIGVWLNDGTGSFYEGDLADFPELARPRGASKWRVQHQGVLLLALVEERIPLAIPGTSALTRFVSSRLVKRSDPSRRDPSNSDFSNRGPPRNA